MTELPRQPPKTGNGSPGPAKIEGPSPAGGTGDHQESPPWATMYRPSDPSASGMSSIREARMIRRAIKRGWIKGQRWPTDASRNEIANAGEQRELTLKETAALAAFDGLAHGDARVKAIHASTVVAMERQNQKDELFADASEALQEPTLPTGDVTVNVQQNNVVADGSSAAEQLRALIGAVTTRGGKTASGSNGNGEHPH